MDPKTTGTKFVCSDCHTFIKGKYQVGDRCASKRKRATCEGILVRRPKAADLPTFDLLAIIAVTNDAKKGLCQSWDLPDFGIAWKIVAAKLSILLRKGYVDGCDCGCRGDWELTNKGYQFLHSHL